MKVGLFDQRRSAIRSSQSTIVPTKYSVSNDTDAGMVTVRVHVLKDPADSLAFTLPATRMSDVEMVSFVERYQRTL